MKNSMPLIILMGTVAFYANLALAQTPATAPEIKPIVSSSLTDQIAQLKKSKEDEASKTKTAMPKVDDSFISDVSGSEMNAHKITLKYSGDSIQVAGADDVADFCLKKITLDVATINPSEDAEAGTDEDGQKSTFVYHKTTLRFHGDNQIKTLSDCDKLTAGLEKGALSLSKDNVYGDSEKKLAYLRYFANGKETDMKEQYSPNAKSILESIKFGKCEDCHKKPEAVAADIKKLMGMDSAAYNKMLFADFRSVLSNFESSIDGAKNLDALKKIADELTAESNLIHDSKLTEEQKNDLIAATGSDPASLYDLLNVLIDKNKEMGSKDSLDKKGNHNEKRESDHVDFTATLHQKASELPGLDEDTKKDEGETAKLYSKADKKHEVSIERLEALSAMNPKHSEIELDKKLMEQHQNILGTKYMNDCMPKNNQPPKFNATQCNGEWAELLDYNKKHVAVLSRIDAAQKIADAFNQNSIFGDPNAQTTQNNFGSYFTIGQTQFDANGKIVAVNPSAQKPTTVSAQTPVSAAAKSNYITFDASRLYNNTAIPSGNSAFLVPVNNSSAPGSSSAANVYRLVNVPSQS